MSRSSADFYSIRERVHSTFGCHFLRLLYTVLGVEEFAVAALYWRGASVQGVYMARSSHGVPCLKHFIIDEISLFLRGDTLSDPFLFK